MSACRKLSRSGFESKKLSGQGLQNTVCFEGVMLLAIAFVPWAGLHRADVWKFTEGNRNFLRPSSMLSFVNAVPRDDPPASTTWDFRSILGMGLKCISSGGLPGIGKRSTVSPLGGSSWARRYASVKGSAYGPWSSHARRDGVREAVGLHVQSGIRSLHWKTFPFPVHRHNKGPGSSSRRRYLLGISSDLWLRMLVILCLTDATGGRAIWLADVDVPITNT